MHEVKAAGRKSYHVEGTVNKGKSIFLVDTGAEVSLISANTPGLVVKDSPVSPVSITHQPISVRGEAEVVLELGDVRTQWKFLVVDNLRESVFRSGFSLKAPSC